MIRTHLKEYNLILGQEKCRQSYGFIQDGHICAGNYNFGGKDSCQGDSGGALWWKHPTTQQIYQVYNISDASCSLTGILIRKAEKLPASALFF